MSVTLKTTLGPLKFELFCDLAPRASENFLALCASSFYNGTVFHRCVKSFILQGGSDPYGKGNYSKSVWGGHFDDELHEKLQFDHRGVLAMAVPAPNRNGSQFFISLAAAPHLNGSCTIFGNLIDGFKTLDQIEALPVDQKHKPLKDVVIESVEIHANPFAEMQAQD